MTTIEQARRDVESISKRLAAIGSQTSGAAAELEDLVWATMLELGRAVMTLSFVQRAGQPRSAEYDHGGRRFRIVGRKRTEIGTRFGKVEFFQPEGRPIAARNGARDLPLMRELAIPAGFTLPVVTIFGRLCAMMAFAQARVLFTSMFGWAPSPRAVLRMIDAAGGQARPFLEQAEPPEGDGPVLVIEVDGKGAPAISSREYARRRQPHGARSRNERHGRRTKRRRNPRPRRAPGKKSKNAKVAAIGAIYTLKRDGNGKLEGPINKRIYGTFASYHALFEWLAIEARKRGYGTSKRSKVLFLADGAEILWTLKERFFPDAEEGLDWYHAVEKLWLAGKALCRGTRRKRNELETWVAAQKQRLREGAIHEVLDVLTTTLENTPATGPGNKYRRVVLKRVSEYFAANAGRMRYKHLREGDLPIASGVIEGAARNVIGVRLDGPGMRWGRDRAEAVLQLRCVLVNGQWSAFESFLRTRTSFRLHSQPVPTRTHDAIPVMRRAA